jgi:hypothetical protein
LDQVACISDKGPMVIDGFFLPFKITSLWNKTNLKQTMHVNQPSEEAFLYYKTLESWAKPNKPLHIIE